MKQQSQPIVRNHKKTWVLVADGARARIFFAHPHALESALDADFISDHRSNQEATADKQGMALGSDHVSRHVFEPHSDWHNYQKQLFAREICQTLIAADEEKKFQSLIIIAPAKILGEIRKDLTKAVHEKIKAEIAKDLTKMNDKDILTYLNEIIVL